MIMRRGGLVVSAIHFRAFDWTFDQIEYCRVGGSSPGIFMYRIVSLDKEFLPHFRHIKV